MIATAFAATLAWSVLAQDSVRLATPEEAAAAAAAFAPNVPPGDGDWRVVWTTADGATAMDVAHIDEQGSTRTVWIATVGGSTRNPPASYALTRLELDCASGVARPLWFALRAVSGANLYGFQPSEPPKAYQPDSGGEKIAAVACLDGDLGGSGFPTHQAFAESIPSGQ